MLPIPAPIIASASATSVNHRKLFIPLIYLGATASLCYLFLFAFIITNESHLRHRGGIREEKYSLEKSEFSDKLLDPIPQQRATTSENLKDFTFKVRKRREKDEFVFASQKTSSEPKRKTLSSFRRKTENRDQHHGAWRSDPTKIRSRDQDLKDHKFKGLLGDQPEKVVTYPWRKDEQCKRFKVQFAKNATFKPRALISFPGSGNTWLRYLIECASGYFTGSVYDDRQIFNAGLLGEFRPPNDGSTIVQKTHHDTIYNMSSRKRKAYIKLSELMFRYRGILLIRNPYDALVSYWNFINTHRNHKQVARRSQFDDFKWVKFVTEEIPRWTSLITSWLNHSRDSLIIFYEHLEKNPRAELGRILDYLSQPSDPARLDCLMKAENLEGPFHREHQTSRKTSGIPLPVDLIPATSQQPKIHVEHYKEDSHDHHNQMGLFPLDSEKSPTPVEGGDDKFLPSTSPSPLPIFWNQYTNTSRSLSNEKNENHKKHHQDDHHESNNHLNNSSILRLDLIIQDNIDEINRFFQQKGIPAQLHYSPGPATKPYFLHMVQ